MYFIRAQDSLAMPTLKPQGNFQQVYHVHTLLADIQLAIWLRILHERWIIGKTWKMEQVVQKHPLNMKAITAEQITEWFTLGTQFANIRITDESSKQSR